MDEAEDTEAVLAAYRERKRKALEAQHAAGPPNGHEPPPSPQPPAIAPSPTHFHFEHPVSQAPTAAPSPPPSAPPALAPAPATSPAASALQAAPRPHPLATAPGATLSALGPALRLSDALLKDHRVSVKGSPGLRAAGVTALLFGLAVIAYDRRLAQAGDEARVVLLAGLLLAAVGCLLVTIGLNFPRNRRLAVRLAASQREEWKRVQGESQRLATLSKAGLALAVLGLLAVAGGYTVASLALWALGALATAAGLALLLAAAVRRGIARRLYVQTMVLSGLEASGLGGGAPDERVTPVILALDDLLGALPEAEVQRFLATPQAKAYLELVDEAARSKRGP